MTVTNINANEPTLASRYLAGQLSDTERAAFEEQMRESPAVMRELEATARLKVGLARLRERGELDELLAPSPWHQHRFALATAAALATIVVGAMLVRFNPVHADHPILAASIASLVDTRGSILPVTGTFAVFRKRAENYDATIEAAAAGAVELRVLPETAAETRRYRVSLGRMIDDRSIEPVATLAGLAPAADGFVTLFVDRAKLPPGRYRLDVAPEGTGDGVVADSFLIRISPRATP